MPANRSHMRALSSFRSRRRSIRQNKEGESLMTERAVSVTLRHVAPDALVGITIFLLVALAAGDSSQAIAAGMNPLTLAWLEAAGERQQAAPVLLAGVLAALAALDVAFFRHLCRTYAPSRPPA
jgi:hypothetical protein